ncbi:MFS transporter, partial [Verrucomicrobia bacterium]|nr:MFS transporter [Verrucomicrobiota bacterium]
MNTTATSPTSEPSTFTRLRSLPRDVWIIFLGSFINRFGTFVIPFLMLHLTKLGYSTGTIALTMAAYGAGHIIASLVGGVLADTFGRRNTIVMSMFTGSVIMICLSFAVQPTAMAGLLFLLGLTAEAYRPASSALI